MWAWKQGLQDMRALCGRYDLHSATRQGHRVAARFGMAVVFLGGIGHVELIGRCGHTRGDWDGHGRHEGTQYEDEDGVAHG